MPWYDSNTLLLYQPSMFKTTFIKIWGICVPFALFTLPPRTTHVGSNQFQEIVSYKIVFFIKRKTKLLQLMKYFTRSLKIFLYWNRFVIDHRWVGSLWLPEGIHSRTMRDLPEEIFSWSRWKSWQQIWQIWPFSSGKSVPTVFASLDGLPRTLEMNLSKYNKHIKCTLIIIQNL